MHSSDEIIDVCAPFGQPPAEALFDMAATAAEGGSNMDINKNSDNNENIAQGPRFFDFDGIGIAGTVGGGSMGRVDEESIANNVDGFVNDFLSLVGPDSALVDCFDGILGIDINMDMDMDMESMDEEDLAWLKSPDAFLPPPGPATMQEDSPVAGGNETAPPVATSPPVEAVLAAESAAPAGGSDTNMVPFGAVGSLTTPAAAMNVFPAPATAGMAAAVNIVAPSLWKPVSVRGVSNSGAEAVVTPYGGDGMNSVNTGTGIGAGTGTSIGNSDCVEIPPKEQLRRQKVARYLDKKKKRRWSRKSSYQSRQRVANSRQRHKGRFVPLTSDFVSVAEMKRRTREHMMKMQQTADQDQQCQGGGCAPPPQGSRGEEAPPLPVGGGGFGGWGEEGVMAVSEVSPGFSNQAGVVGVKTPGSASFDLTI